MKKMTKRKPFKPELWILVAGLLVIVLFLVYLYLAQYKQTNIPINEPVACTMDAKVCPDGSAVGRIAPNCEFAKCPGE